MECKVCGQALAHTMFDKQSCIFCETPQEPEPED